MQHFRGLGVPEPLARRLAALNIHRPTSIQATALPVVMAGKDAVVTAETGSGKTLMYALPALARCKGMMTTGKGAKPDCVVLAPSHELCRQIDTVIRSIDGTIAPRMLHRSEDVTGERLSGIIIGTPGLVHNVSLHATSVCMLAR